MEQMIPVAATALLGGLIAVFLKREAGEISLLLSIATTVLLLVLVGSAAVSYTHLDVYKRQTCPGGWDSS